MDNHPIRHKSWIWVSSDGNVRMVACRTCGHIEPYNPTKHDVVEDVD
jgi:hypothetical protein